MRNIIVYFILLLQLILSGSSVMASWSDLEIVSYTLIDSGCEERGVRIIKRFGECIPERWARITVRNPKGVDNIVQDRYFIATLMDNEGTKVEGSGLSSSIRLGPGEVRTVTIYFGRQKWPISNIEVK